MKRINYVGMVALGVVLFAAAGVFAVDGADTLVTRLPQTTNAILAADVGFLRESPQAGRMKWVARGAAGENSTLLPSIPGVKHVCIAAHLNLDHVRPDWELALIQVSPVPPIKQIAQQLGGYTDMIGATPAAWSAQGACFVGLDNQTLVSAQPGDRQLVARWLEHARAAGPTAQGPSAYLLTASKMVNAQTPIVLAVDLRDAFSIPEIARWLQLSSSDETAKGDSNPGAVAKVLATVQGVTFQVNVGDTTSATATINFQADASPLAAIAQPMFLDVLSQHGVTIADMSKWAFAVTGTAVTATGPLSDQGLREVLSVLQAPSPAGMENANGGAQGSAANPPGARNGSSAAASPSRRYFDSVAAVLDNIKPGATLNGESTWLWQYASRIDKLPAQGVDAEVLAWGAEVSSDLRQAAGILDAGQSRVTAAAQSGQAPVGAYSTSYDDDGGEARNAQYRANLENYRRQNRQAAAQIRAQVSAEASKPLQKALDSRGQMRAKMAGK